MKPDYLQTKIEQLMYENEQFRKKTEDMNVRIASIESNLRSLQDQFVTVKNQPQSYKISEVERNEFLTDLSARNRRYLKKEMKSTLRVLGAVVGADLCEFKTHEERFICHYIGQCFKMLEKVRQNHDNLVVAVNKIINIIDPEHKQLNKQGTIVTKQAMLRRIRRTNHVSMRRCLKMVEEGATA